MPQHSLTVALILAMSVIARPQSVSRQQIPTIKSGTELVALNVTAADSSGRAVTALRQEQFSVYENDVEQTIAFFNSDETPVSWGLVLDRSSSMAMMIDDVYQAALHTIEEGTAADETFIVTFSDKPELVREFESDRHRLENALLGLRAGGVTALWDATAFALEHILKGRHQKKVLVVVTDGDDNRSELAFRDLVDLAEHYEVLIYTVGMVESAGFLDRFISRAPWRRDLEKLSAVTGARAHFPRNLDECRKTMKEIAREVGQQYTIGYYPQDVTRDGKWRSLKVVIKARPGQSAVTARTRLGYYAPKSAGL